MKNPDGRMKRRSWPVIGQAYLFLLIGAILLSSGCEILNTQKLLDSVNTLEKMADKIDTTGAKLAGGMAQGFRDTLTSAKTKRDLDSLVSLLASAAAGGIVDTLTSDKSKKELDSLLSYLLTHARDSLTSKYTIAKIDAALDKLGGNVQTQVIHLRDSLIGDVTAERLEFIVTKILGPAARKEIDTLIANSIKNFASGYQEHIRPLVQKEEESLNKQMRNLLWTAGSVIALLLILAGLLFFWNRRHRKLLEMLTFQIHSMGNQQEYDNLVKRINSNAIRLSLEPQLRTLLVKQGINKDDE